MAFTVKSSHEKTKANNVLVNLSSLTFVCDTNIFKNTWKILSL